MTKSGSMRVAFCHLDLGVGGAERFIVDSACHMQLQGVEVHMYTSHYDPNRCFDETKGLDVRVAGSWLPRAVLNSGTVVFAWLRMLCIAICVAWNSRREGQNYDFIVVDQDVHGMYYGNGTVPRDVLDGMHFAKYMTVSSIIPLLKLCTSARIVFYGHFPDLLLASHTSALRRAYRRIFDWTEGATTAAAHSVLVNSLFTRDVYRRTFPALERRHTLHVLYPTVPLPLKAEVERLRTAWPRDLEDDLVRWIEGGSLMVSINRYERKKNIGLAIRALHEVISRHAFSSGACARCRLIIAGGYDPRVRENVDHAQELESLADELDVRDRVVFLRNVTGAERCALLAAARLVVYTPEREHFGIVPLEAMSWGCPVIACASGGPRETIEHLRTGMLTGATAMDFANAMVLLLTQREGDARVMRAACWKHVAEHFSHARLVPQWWQALGIDPSDGRAPGTAAGQGSSDGDVQPSEGDSKKVA